MATGSDVPPVFTSWKEIANYMGKGVRTVQRWEQDFGLPVRRPSGSQKRAILARPRDLDAWVALRCSSRTQMQNGNLPTGSRTAAVSVLSALSSEIETSRRLRYSNQVLTGEITAALDLLKRQLASLCRPPTAG